MAKKITVKQLKRAFDHSPTEVAKEGRIFLIRGLAEYKRVSLQSTPWRVGSRGGGIPTKSGNLKEKHRTVIKGLEGKFGVSPRAVRYARYVHEGTRKMRKRPWLDYARLQADNAVKEHYQTFMDNILKFIAT